MRIACVVPTIRPEQHERFMEAWAPLFDRHQVIVLTVWDGDMPIVEGCGPRDVLGPDADLIYHRSDVCRNLGLAYIAARLPSVTHILTLDDDVAPRGDTIADHVTALTGYEPISWLSSSPDAYTRGFPYGVRSEAPIMVSHGVWYGNADWDARTQIENGNAPLSSFYTGVVPKGCLFPFCGMNVMVKRAALPLFYFAPMGPQVDLGDGQIWDRFGDIFLGITLKRELDRRGWAMMSGMARVEHTRASDVHVNLRKEAASVELNERYWAGQAADHPYVQLYDAQRRRWERWVERHAA